MIPKEDFVRGEIEVGAFWKAFTWIQRNYKDKDPDCWHNAFNKPGGIFIDLGPCSSRGALMASMIH